MSTMSSSRRVAGRPPDWARFGLEVEQKTPELADNTDETTHLKEYFDYKRNIGTSETRELFAEETGSEPWWKSNFFVSGPILFGTWDGVYTSCMINILGVIVFLRSGWIVAQAGIWSSVGVILVSVLVILTSVLSAIGICERSQIQSGGVYFLLSQTMGSRFGGAVGIIYCFGQAVGCSLHASGFGESIADLFSIDNPWAERGFGVCLIVLLTGINMAGVKWVIKLQFILLLILFMGAGDFAIGSFLPPKNGTGFEGWSLEVFNNNSLPAYTEGNNWFSIFGVFFPTVTGVMAGINMSGDLRDPGKSIPTGSLSAILTSTFMYLMFVVILGSTVARDYLMTDYLIMQKVAALGVLVLMGLYVASMSSVLAAMFGTPRVLQSIASQKVIPALQFLERGRGPNKVPVMSLALVGLLILCFVLIGQINRLAPIVTLPFLLTYASVDYSYFALAQSFEIQQKRSVKPKALKNLPSPSFEANVQASPASGSRHDHEGEDAEGYSPFSHLPEEENNPGIRRQPSSWYSPLCNRWVSLIGAVTKIVVMLLVHWAYGLVLLALTIALYVYIGRASTGFSPGFASEFSFFRWIKSSFNRIRGKEVVSYEEMIVAADPPGISTEESQVTEGNADFSWREPFHQVAAVGHKHMDRLSKQ